VGFNGCWIAVKDRDFDELAKEIGLERTGAEVLTHPFETEHNAGPLRGGWSLFVCGRFEDRLVQDDALSKLSQGTRLVACAISETVMVSEAQFWANGVRVWRVQHDCQKGDINHLLVEGERLLKSLEGHRQKAIAEREKDSEVDFMFDVPLYLAREMTGSSMMRKCRRILSFLRCKS
jgi:hypothetical protein